MTLPSSGPISLSQIKAEFLLGDSLSDYCGVRWFKDDNSRGFFDNSLVGNRPPLDFSEFYGKRKTIPVVPTGNVSYGNGSYFTVPFYNKLYITLKGGDGGQGGAVGYYSGGYKDGELTAGSSGGGGGTSQFGSTTLGSPAVLWASASGGGGGGGGGNSGAAGSTVTLVIDAENTSNAPLKNATIYVGVGGGGGGGGGGAIWVSSDGKWAYNYAGTASSGSAGSGGYLTVRVE